jgi:hypothetical protein
MRSKSSYCQRALLTDCDFVLKKWRVVLPGFYPISLGTFEDEKYILKASLLYKQKFK